MANQAFLTKIYIDSDDTIRAEQQKPVGPLLDPHVQEVALNWPDSKKRATQTHDVRDLSKTRRVGSFVEFSNTDQHAKSLVSRVLRRAHRTSCEVPTGEFEDPRGINVTQLAERQTRLSPADKAALIRDRAGGASVTSLVRRYGVSRDTVWRHTERHKTSHSVART